MDLCNVSDSHTPAVPAQRNTRAGFTLVELIIVVALVLVLMSMSMAVYSVVRQSMLDRSTQNVLRKVDGCLRLFRGEWGVYPYQQSYPTTNAGTAFPNRLFYQIGTDISWSGSPSDAARVKTDALTAAGKFNDSAPPGGVSYRTTDVSGGSSVYSGRLNSAARERARLAVLAGNLDLRGPLITDLAGATVTDRRATAVLTTAERTSAANMRGPGWACDYLKGDIERKYVSGDALLDARGRPLIYICQVVPGVRMGSISTTQVTYNNVRYGLGVQGFESTAGPASGIVAAGRGMLLYQGRIRLSQDNAGDGKPTPIDATLCPDLGTLLHSDRRYYAAPGVEEEFELWSSGRDGGFDYLRDAPANRDNFAAGPYDRELR